MKLPGLDAWPLWSERALRPTSRRGAGKKRKFLGYPSGPAFASYGPSANLRYSPSCCRSRMVCQRSGRLILWRFHHETDYRSVARSCHCSRHQRMRRYGQGQENRDGHHARGNNFHDDGNKGRAQRQQSAVRPQALVCSVGHEAGRSTLPIAGNRESLSRDDWKVVAGKDSEPCGYFVAVFHPVAKVAATKYAGLG